LERQQRGHSLGAGRKPDLSAADLQPEGPEESQKYRIRSGRGHVVVAIGPGSAAVDRAAMGGCPVWHGFPLVLDAPARSMQILLFRK
jgi:hypothetical protein